jgi:hypothetical protein
MVAGSDRLVIVIGGVETGLRMNSQADEKT